MNIQSFSILEQTPMLSVLTVLLLGMGAVGTSVMSAHIHSRATAFQACLVVVGAAFTAGAMALSHYSMPQLYNDMGVMSALGVLLALGAVAGAHDRTRLLGRILLALIVSGALMVFVLPVQEVFFKNSVAIAPVFAALVVSGVVLLLFSALLPCHITRFSAEGSYRVTEQNLVTEVTRLLCAIVLTIGLSLLLWRLKAFVGVNTAFHMFATLLGAMIAAATASLFARRQGGLSSLRLAAAAMPSGAIIAAMFDGLPVEQVVLISMGMGAVIAYARTAVIAQRIDEPSDWFISITVPALCVWIVAGLMDVKLIAQHIQMTGFWLFSAVSLAVLARALVALLVGMETSGRRMREGMDTQVAAP